MQNNSWLIISTLNEVIRVHTIMYFLFLYACGDFISLLFSCQFTRSTYYSLIIVFDTMLTPHLRMQRINNITLCTSLPHP